MATMRMLAGAPGLAPGKTERDILERVLAWLRNPGDVTSIVLHAPGAHLVGSDGREYLIGPDGEPRALGETAAYGFTSC